MKMNYLKKMKKALPLAVAAALLLPPLVPSLQQQVYAAEAQAAVQAVSERQSYVVKSTENGAIRGFKENGVEYFRGIPYAKPPVKELRWQPPQKADDWQGVLDATNYQSEAAQTDYLGEFATPGGSEDCLYLNVAVPEPQPGDPDKLPVLVWIHGGALVVGSGNDYNPELLAKEGRAIVVTVNYRLGVFGYFAHPALDAEKHSIINYGVMDQIAALEWVQRNIEGFGGNPAEVTIAGESAGGQSSQILMASPKAKGLFKNVIAMSAPVLLGDGHAIPTEKAEEKGVALAKAAGLENATAEELRALSTDDLLKLENQFVLDGVIAIDPEYVPTSVGEAFEQGRVNGEKLGIGNVANEGSFISILTEKALNKPLDEAAYKTCLEGLEQKYGIPGFAEKLQQEYPLSAYGSPAEAYAQILTDSWFAAPIYRIADRLDRQMQVYYYEFDVPEGPHYMAADFHQGTAHTYELPFLFPGFNGGSDKDMTLTKEQQALAHQMARLWAKMSEMGKESGWEQFDSDSNAKYLQLSLPAAGMKDMADYKARHHFDFWQNVKLY